MKLRPAIEASATATQAVPIVAVPKIRGHLFAMEGLLRLYAQHDTMGKSAERLLKEAVKPFEDALGKYDEAVGLLKFGREVDAPAGLVEFLIGREVVAKGVLAKFLTDEKWVPFALGAYSRLASSLERLPWDSEKEDRAFFLKRIRKSVTKVDDEKYDLTKLEEGIHELRRDVRWISIQAAASRGLLILGDRCEHPQLRPLLTHSIAGSPYAKLPVFPDVKAPCVISRCVFLAIVKAVDEIGQVKEIGQAEHFLKDAIEESGIPLSGATPAQLARHLVHRHPLVKQHPQYADVFRTARVLYEELKGSDALKLLAKEIDSCRK